MNEEKKGVIALIILAFIFATMGVFARFLNTNFTILQQTYLRIFAAFLFGYAIFYRNIDIKKILKISRKDWLLLVFRAICLYVLGVTLLSEAFITGKYSNVSFISSLPLTAILGFVLLKEKVTLQKVLYICLGFIGVILIAVNDYSNLFSWGHGEFVALIASVFFALSYIARKWQSNLLNNQEIAVLIFFISSILLFISSLFLGEGLPHANSFSTVIVLALGISALFNVANLFLTNYGFQKVPAVLASNLLMLEALFALIISICLYKEFPTLKEYIGGILIIVSAYQMNKIS